MVYSIPFAQSDFNGPPSMPLADASTNICYLAGLGDLLGNTTSADTVDVFTVPYNNGTWWFMSKARAAMKVSATCIPYNQ